LVLSRRGREEKEEKILRKPLTLTLSRGGGCVVIWFLFENFID
jgi:hypothetical protein